MRRVRKIALWFVGIMVVVAAVGWFGLRWYLSTESARRMVAGEVSGIIGLPVEVTSLDVGFGGTSVSVTIPDPAAETPGHFVRVGKIETDITLGGLATGSASPTAVTVRDADIVLRLDANRKIVSPLPKFEGDGGGGKLPAIKLENARIRIRQPGKPEFDIGGVNGSLRADGDGYAITGDIADPKWGQWKIEGKLGADPADGHVTLSCADATLSDPLLQSIPFVPEKVWQHLSASGSAAASVTLTFKPTGDLDYAVSVRPNGASLTLPDVDATLTDVTGDIRIANGKVTADGGSLSLATGNVTASGEFVFDAETYVLTLKVKADGVDVQKLPAAWGLPKGLEGKLKGTADLKVLIPDDGKMDTRGSGEAEVEDAKFLGQKAEIKLQLKGDNNGHYRFVTMPLTP
jgi:uncharacterized protein YhdP